MATQRAHLQHEVDILSQKASQDALALKDDMRGMLNDRKMAVRMQQQARDSAIQELNYKITVSLNSDSKSEVEGLRWVLTRRAAMAIAGMARKSQGSFPGTAPFSPPYFLLNPFLPPKFFTHQSHQTNAPPKNQSSSLALSATPPTSSTNVKLTARITHPLPPHLLLPHLHLPP